MWFKPTDPKGMELHTQTLVCGLKLARTFKVETVQQSRTSWSTLRARSSSELLNPAPEGMWFSLNGLPTLPNTRGLDGQVTVIV